MKIAVLQTFKRGAYVLLAMVLSLQMLIPLAASATNYNHKVRICHATGSSSNPFSSIEVDNDAVDGNGNANSDHNRNDHQDGEDIIPPNYTNGANGYWPSRNWDAKGQAIWNNKCQTTRVEVKKVVVPSNDNGKFNLRIEGDTFAANVGDGGTTGEVYVDEEKNITISETQGSSTSISNYSTSIVCKDKNGTGKEVKSGNSTSVTINAKDIGKNDDIVCVITNTRQTGGIKVNKKVDVGQGYVNDNPSNYGFRWGIDNGAADKAMGSTATGTTTGNHTVKENTVNGYAFTGWYYTSQEVNQGSRQVNCSYPQGTTLPVPVTVSKNEIKEVTFCNKVQRGAITIVKDSQPNSDQDFEFIASGSIPNFKLDDDSNNTLSNTKTTGNLLPGTYTFEEKAQSGWSLDDISCAQGTSYQVDLANRKVSINLPAGGSASCTFTNKKHGKIIVDKKTLPSGSSQKFTVITSGDGVIGDSSKSVSDSSNAYITVKQGSYSVSEIPAEGWTEVSNTCNQLSVTAENLEVRCEIVNQKKSSIKIIKDANPKDAQDFTFTSNVFESFMLDDDDDNTLSNWKKFNGLNPGTYIFSENEVEGWRLDDVDCENVEEWEFDDETGKLTLYLEAGEDARCTFENDGNVGNGNTGRIYGHKFEDINGNGNWDEEEPAIEDWTIYLTRLCEEIELSIAVDSMQALMQVNEEIALPQCEETTTETLTKGNNGFYFFDVQESGTYKICEKQEAEWVQTYPSDNGCYEVKVSKSGFYGSYDFGNQHRPHAIEIEIAPVCVNGLTYLNWSMTATNFTPVQFTFDWYTNPGDVHVPAATSTVLASDPSVTVNGSTYSGKILWPGASITPADWPGYSFVNGSWVVDPNDLGGNLRPYATLKVSTNPTAEAVVAYPSDSSCDPSNGAVLGASTLKNTGNDTLVVMILAAVFIATVGGIQLAQRKNQ